MRGVVSRINSRGFGFIESRELGSRDCFFHATALQLPLTFDEELTGQAVDFDVEQTDKGPRALSVRLAY